MTDGSRTAAGGPAPAAVLTRLRGAVAAPGVPAPRSQAGSSAEASRMTVAEAYRAKVAAESAGDEPSPVVDAVVVERPAGPLAPVPPLVPRPPARPRVEDDTSILGLSRHSRSRVGSRLFTLFFVGVFGLILVQMVVALLHP